MIIGYGKIGRSMPLTLAGCGNLGGDVEMAAVVSRLALRHPNDTFVLIGRNTGETPTEAGLPGNVINPWVRGGMWHTQLREGMARAGIKDGPLTPDKHAALAKIFDYITGEMFDSLGGLVLWVGQHGTSNLSLPGIRDLSAMTKPQDWCAYYSAFLMQGTNRWRDVDPMNREEVYLNADARNHHKMRDLKWPLRHPVLGQFNSSKTIQHERYGDERVPSELGWGDIAGCRDKPFLWNSMCYTTYSRLEINGLYPGTPFGDLISYSDDWVRPGNFGLFVNEAGALGREDLRRLPIVLKWVMPLQPHFMHGTWSDDSQQLLGRHISPAPWSEYYPKLHSVRCTFTTPSSCSGWATAKPWEAFAAGTVCFFHPKYDTQNHILGDASDTLRDWLRVADPTSLRARVAHLASESGRADWEWLVREQRAHFDSALREERYMKMIEKRVFGDAA